MYLTKGWKITIVGLIVGIMGLSLWGVNRFLEIWNISNFDFEVISFVGLTLVLIGNLTRQREKNPKSQNTPSPLK
jgi:hypothetical protein